MRQTRMAKGDFHISRRSSHADFNIAYSEVKVRMPNQLKTPSNKGKIKFDVSFHDGFRFYVASPERPYACSRTDLSQPWNSPGPSKYFNQVWFKSATRLCGWEFHPFPAASCSVHLRGDTSTSMSLSVWLNALFNEAV